MGIAAFMLLQVHALVPALYIQVMQQLPSSDTRRGLQLSHTVNISSSC